MNNSQKHHEAVVKWTMVIVMNGRPAPNAGSNIPIALITSSKAYIVAQLPMLTEIDSIEACPR